MTLQSSLQYSEVPLGTLMFFFINLEYSGIHLESLMGLPHTMWVTDGYTKYSRVHFGLLLDFKSTLRVFGVLLGSLMSLQVL